MRLKKYGFLYYLVTTVIGFLFPKQFFGSIPVLIAWLIGTVLFIGAIHLQEYRKTKQG